MRITASSSDFAVPSGPVPSPPRPPAPLLTGRAGSEIPRRRTHSECLNSSRESRAAAPRSKPVATAGIWKDHEVVHVTRAFHSAYARCPISTHVAEVGQWSLILSPIATLSSDPSPQVTGLLRSLANEPVGIAPSGEYRARLARWHCHQPST